MEDTIQAALQIVKLVPVDPPIAMVTRLISSYPKVTSCRTDPKEKLSIFVSRFRGLAAKHLLHSNASSTSQIGEVLAITLLKNANLEDETLTNAKLQPISHAQARSKEKEIDNASNGLVLKEILAELQTISEQLQILDASIRDSEMSASELKKEQMYYRSKNASLCRQLLRSIKDLKASPQGNSNKTSVDVRFLSQNKSCRLKLDDAVIILRNLTHISSMDSLQFSMKDVQAMVDRKVKSFLTSQPGTARFPISSHLGDRNTHKYPTASPFQRLPAKGIRNAPLRNSP